MGGEGFCGSEGGAFFGGSVGPGVAGGCAVVDRLKAAGAVVRGQGKRGGFGIHRE